MKTIGIKEVARKAQVSTATVSLISNGKSQGRFPPETVERVNRVMNELHYTPNPFARRAGLSRTPNMSTMGIGFILGGDISSPLMHPFHGLVLQGCDAAIHRGGYHLVFSSAFPDAANKINHIRRMQGREVDGWLLAARIETEVLDFLAHQKIPAVILGGYTEGAGKLCQVRTDDVQGGYLATKHLLAQGYRRIIFVCDYPTSSACSWRLQGYRNALEEAGLEYDRRAVIVEGDEKVLLRSLDARLEAGAPPAGLVTTGDMLAIKIVEHLRRKGLVVPRDVGITGFDDLEAARKSRPPLTTVRIPREEVGAAGFRKLLSILLNPEAMPSLTLLPVSLIVRESSGPVPSSRRCARQERKADTGVNGEVQ